MFLIVLALICLISALEAKKVAVFGASGGVGQQICAALRRTNFQPIAISRNKEKLLEFPLLNGCDICFADALKPETLSIALEDADHVVISVGTTAFPTQKWKNGNNPEVACFKTVENILLVISSLKKKPENVVILSSIGVERTDKPPFSILNSFGVLEAKRRADELLLKKASEDGYRAIVCRPGRLLGAPFTNTDLAKLFQKDQGEKKGIVLDTRDVINGEVERKDVAESITRILSSDLPSGNIVYSIVNKDGPAPSEFQWGKILSLFTVPKEELLTTRET